MLNELQKTTVTRLNRENCVGASMVSDLTEETKNYLALTLVIWIFHLSKGDAVLHSSNT